MKPIVYSNAGIYGILHKDSMRWYIGSTINIKRRWINHLWTLRTNQHSSKHLQAAWNKYKAGAFEFLVLEMIQPSTDRKELEEVLAMREQHFMSLHQATESGFNFAPVARSLIGVERPPATIITKTKLSAAHKGKPKSFEAIQKSADARRGAKRTEEQKARIREGQRNSPKSRPYRYYARGLVFTPEHRAKLSLASKGKSKTTETKANMKAAWILRKCKKENFVEADIV